MFLFNSSIEEITERYGYQSNLDTLRELVRADAKLWTYSKYEVTLHGDLDDVADECKYHYEKFTHPYSHGPIDPLCNADSYVDHLLNNSPYIFNRKRTHFTFIEKPGRYKLNRETLLDYFNDYHADFIPKHTPNVIIQYGHGILLNGSMPTSLTWDKIIVDQRELELTLGSARPSIDSPFYYAFEDKAEKYTATYQDHYYEIWKDFSKINTPETEKVSLTGFQQQIFKVAFKLHHERNGRMFRSGEVMNKIDDHKYKGLGDYLLKNRTLSGLFLKQNDKGYYRLKMPLFSDYVRSWAGSDLDYLND